MRKQFVHKFVCYGTKLRAHLVVMPFIFLVSKNSLPQRWDKRGNSITLTSSSIKTTMLERSIASKRLLVQLHFSDKWGKAGSRNTLLLIRVNRGALLLASTFLDPAILDPAINRTLSKTALLVNFTTMRFVQVAGCACLLHLLKAKLLLLRRCVCLMLCFRFSTHLIVGSV